MQQTVFGLSADGVLAWITAASRALDQGRAVMNAANVFPVADSDTGTNMALTVRAARLELERHLVRVPGETPAGCLAVAARGALRGARGNSGVILAEFCAGIAKSAAAEQVPAELATRESAAHSEGADLARALILAHEMAVAAVGTPIDGTILTAAGAAAQAAGNQLPAPEVTALRVAQAAALAADGALDRSSSELAVLARSRVLDAGAYGLVLILAALVQTLGGGQLSAFVRTDLAAAEVQPRTEDLVLGHVSDLAHLHEHTDVDGEFEVMVLIEAPAGVAVERGGDDLRTGLRGLGESVVVIGGANAGGGALWQCHVHTDSPEQVLRFACGSADAAPVVPGAHVFQVMVRSLSRQVRQRDQGGTPVGIVVATDSPGVVMDLARSGAVVVVRGTRDISHGEIDRAIQEFVHANPIVVTNSDRLRDDLRTHAGMGDTATDGYPHLVAEHIVGGRDDIHVVAAVAALTQELTAGPVVTGRGGASLTTSETGLKSLVDLSGPAVLTRLVAIAEDVIAAVTYVRIEPTGRADLAWALDQLFATSGDEFTVPVLTALVDQNFPTRFLTDLAAGIEHRHPDAELSTLGSGRLDSGATICIEWL